MTHLGIFEGDEQTVKTVNTTLDSSESSEPSYSAV